MLPALALAALLAAGCAAGGRAGAPEDRDDRVDLIAVRGGSFRMGDAAGIGLESERPAREVTVGDFSLGRHEVTVAQFAAFVAATGYRTDVERAGGALDIDPVMRTAVRRPEVNWRTPGFPQDERGPVVWVSWNDAAAYAAWLARTTGRPYRLPTEAEWEYAARERGRDLRWAGTDDPSRAGEYVWSAENSGGVPHPVGGRAPNALGFHDLSGNVWEWCQDWFAPYPAHAPAQSDPRGPPEGRFRALRGGSWRVGPEIARTTYRNGYRPDYAHASIGFRVALGPGINL